MSVRNILDGTIPVGGSIPDELTVKRLNTISLDVKGFIALDHDDQPATTLIKGPHITTPNLYASNGVSTKYLTTDEITLGGEDVLVSKRADVTLVAQATFVGDTTGTYSAKIASKILDITPSIRALSVITSLSSCKTMKSLIINTGLKLEGHNYRAFGTTVCKIGDSYLDAYVDLLWKLISSMQSLPSRIHLNTLQ